MLINIRGTEGNKCTDMIAKDFRYHRECMNFYLTRCVHAQEKSNSDKSLYDAALTQLISRIDEPLFRHGSIFFGTALRDEFHKYLKNLGIDNATSYRSVFGSPP